MAPGKSCSVGVLADVIGFSRIVRRGGHIAVAGTAPIAPNGRTHALGDPYGQAARCIEIIKAALEGEGASLDDVVRTRVMLKSGTDWREAARAHREAFTATRPVCTFVHVSGFIEPEWLVEIEADAIVGAEACN